MLSEFLNVVHGDLCGKYDNVILPGDGLCILTGPIVNLHALQLDKQAVD